MSDSPTPKDVDGKTPLPKDINVAVQGAPEAVLEEGTLDPVYAAKAGVLNKAIQDVGMGRYQWQVSVRSH